MSALLGVAPWTTQITVGLAVGAFDFLWASVATKVCLLAGVKIERFPDPNATPLSLVFDKKFGYAVVERPIIEEVHYRGFLQPIVAFAAYRTGLPLPDRIAIIAIGILFGTHHQTQKGSGCVVTMQALTGCIYGALRDAYGLPAAILAHMVRNLMVITRDKYCPDFLQSDLAMPPQAVETTPHLQQKAS